jgi:hypothetical protein
LIYCKCNETTGDAYSSSAFSNKSLANSCASLSISEINPWPTRINIALKTTESYLQGPVLRLQFCPRGSARQSRAIGLGTFRYPTLWPLWANRGAFPSQQRLLRASIRLLSCGIGCTLELGENWSELRCDFFRHLQRVFGVWLRVCVGFTDEKKRVISRVMDTSGNSCFEACLINFTMKLRNELQSHQT